LSFKQRLEAAAQPFGYAAGLFLVAMMLITVGDVLLRWLFNFPIAGTLDLVELFFVTSLFLAIPGVFLRDENISVDVMDNLAGRRGVAVLRYGGLMLSLLFVAALMWRIVETSAYSFGSPEVTASIEIPKWVHWLPILFGTGASVLALAVILMRPRGVVSEPPKPRLE